MTWVRMTVSIQSEKQNSDKYDDLNTGLYNNQGDYEGS